MKRIVTKNSDMYSKLRSMTEVVIEMGNLQSCRVIKEAGFDDAKHPRGKGGRFAPTNKVLKHFEKDHASTKHLSSYKGSGYKQINGYLTGQTRGSPETKEAVKSIDQAFKESALTQDEVLYRGVNKPALAANAEKYVGHTIQNKAYQSTSRNPDKASHFGSGDRNTDNQVLFVITAPKGTPAIHMDQFPGSDVPNEQEILLNRGTRFKVDDVQRQKGKPVVMYVTVRK